MAFNFKLWVDNPKQCEIERKVISEGLSNTGYLEFPNELKILDTSQYKHISHMMKKKRRTAEKEIFWQ